MSSLSNAPKEELLRIIGEGQAFAEELCQMNEELERERIAAVAERDRALAAKHIAEQALNEAKAAIQEVLERLKCPITDEIMKDAMLICACGHTFSEVSLILYEVSQAGRYWQTCPICRELFCENDLMENYAVRDLADVAVALLRVMSM
ncbi:hypothetical protein SCHPADRAFT_996895 [Schizopora paradoxa]|uniref:Zinc finger RING-type eukaryotic domain-containing protein n=1 Tax=Schizopora paradoxa TaxID=27342 RepID=A0A0H2RPW3_9AGAM|nr:hypothetical protein SCHPADRAFT_996895 [Schizopora paradoxa]